MSPNRNEALARKINHDTRANPGSPYAGKCVAIVGGQVAFVAETVDELGQWLDRTQPPADDSTWIEASADYDEPVYIWGNY